MRRLALSLAVALSLGACASAGRSGASSPRPDPDLLTADEIAAAHVLTALDAVRSLRPRFLMTQGGTTRPHAVQVIVDDVPRGAVAVLSSINASTVVAIRYLSPGDATRRYGTGSTGGLLLVRTGAPN